MSVNFWNDKTLNYAALAIPAFFLFLGLEYFAALRKNKRHLFKFDSSIANISIGIAERLLNLFLTASFYGAFSYIYEHFALWSIPNHWVVWVFLLLITDLPLFSLKFRNFSWKDNRIRFVFLLCAIAFLVLLGYAGIPLIIVFYVLLSIVDNIFLKKEV